MGIEKFSRGKMILVGSSALATLALSPAASIADLRRLNGPRSMSLPAGWSITRTGNAQYVYHNGVLVGSVTATPNPDYSFDMSATGASPQSPIYGAHFPNNATKNTPITTSWGGVFTPTGQSTSTYNAGQTYGNPDGSLTIQDTQYGNLVIKWNGEPPPCHKPPCPQLHVHRDVSWQCIFAQLAAQGMAGSFCMQALRALAAAGWVLDLVPGGVFIELGFGAFTVLSTCLAAYAICSNT